MTLTLLALTGCRFEEPPPIHIEWGDLHNHTNLSFDGCEDAADGCVPDAAEPAEETFPRALANGLSFAAITDHAEFRRYVRDSEGVELDIWDRTRELVQAAEGTGVFGVMGFEWTSNCSDQPEHQRSHRTVLVEDVDACGDWRIPSCHGTGVQRFGDEVYATSDIAEAVDPDDLLERLGAVPDIDGCAPSRTVAFFHHPAQTVPAPIDWSQAYTWVEGDTVVEIASEHGSSECDTTDGVPDGCDWRYDAERYLAEGSIQRMLQQGHQLGFVGGTDNHVDDPGGVSDGPGEVRDIDGAEGTYNTQFFDGTLTGAITTEDALTRSGLFDALDARHTVAASWPAKNLQIVAWGSDDARYLPGDDVPADAMPLKLDVTLDDPDVTDWSFELVDPEGGLSTEESFELGLGDARYVRIRAWIGPIEHRVFASPFFGAG